MQDILESDSGSVEWIPMVKEALVDDFVYSEILETVAGDVLQNFKEDEGLETRDDIITAIRQEELYERVLDLGIKLRNLEEGVPEEKAYEDSIFDSVVQVSDAVGVDYALRGGKRLRPALTMLTEYALEENISYKSAMIGGAVELVHASSLIHDDEMDKDELRRELLSSERINRAYHGKKGWMHSVLDGNKVEAWANKAVVSITGSGGEFDGIDSSVSQKFPATQVDLNDGQKRDLSMEETDLRNTSMDNYKSMIEGKTGALYRVGVEMVLEDHLEEKDYSEEEKDEIRGHFETYIDNFNILFQGGDDAIEVFKPEKSGKSVTDIPNRKSTFPALVTKESLKEESDDYAELFLDVFDRDYDEIDNGMRETAEQMGVPIPEELTGEIQEELRDMGLGVPDDSEETREVLNDYWLTKVIREYGEGPANRMASEYLEEASEAMAQLSGKEVINETARDKYVALADYVWSREH